MYYLHTINLLPDAFERHLGVPRPCFPILQEAIERAMPFVPIHIANDGGVSNFFASPTTIESNEELDNGDFR
jgi:hypothetical protein